MLPIGEAGRSGTDFVLIPRREKMASLPIIFEGDGILMVLLEADEVLELERSRL
jgi:hypothetical protein